jgi:site-specific DNA-methyltransferase (adenine-specific)
MFTFHGDCIEEMKKLDDRSVDLVICDLPYCITKSDWNEEVPLDKLWDLYRRVVKPNGAIIQFAAQPFTSKMVMSAPDLYRYSLVWKKNKASGHLNAKKMPMRIHEDLLVFYQKQPTYNPQKTIGHRPMNRNYSEGTEALTSSSVYQGKKRTTNQAGSTERYPTTVLEFNAINANDPIRQHPNQKPVPLLQWLIKTYSNKGDTVLDNAMGVGSTGIAAWSLGREFIGIEKSLEYYEIAKRNLLMV